MIAIILIFTAGIMITLSINSIYKESLKLIKTDILSMGFYYP